MVLRTVVIPTKRFKVFGNLSDTVRLIEEAFGMLAASIANDSTVFTSSAMTRTGKRTPYSQCRYDDAIRRYFEKLSLSKKGWGLFSKFLFSTG